MTYPLDLKNSKAAFFLHDIIVKNLRHGRSNLMLTGGNSASQLYRIWSSIRKSPFKLGGINIYFSDERMVSSESSENNCQQTISNLFPLGIPSSVSVYPMGASELDMHASASAYERILPPSIDMLILSVGDDGHIASIFPNSEVLNEEQTLIMPSISPSWPLQRLTITPNVIKNAREVYVLAFGEKKRLVYEKAISDPLNTKEMPVRLVLDRTWIFGE